MRAAGKRTEFLIQILVGSMAFFVTFAGQAAFAALLRVGHTQAAPGQSGVQISVDLASEEGEEASAVVFDLHFVAEDLAFVDARAGSAAQAAEKSISTSLVEEGTLRVLIFGLNRNVIGNGSVVAVTFDVNPTAATGKSVVSLDSLSAASPDGENVPATALDGYVDIQDSETPPEENAPPTVVARAAPLSGPPPMVVAFRAEATDSDGTIASYHWDFGDGNLSSEQNPTHVYTEAGTYTAVITATDDGGATGTQSLSISVNALIPPRPKGVRISVSPRAAQRNRR